MKKIILFLLIIVLLIIPIAKAFDSINYIIVGRLPIDFSFQSELPYNVVDENVCWDMNIGLCDVGSNAEYYMVSTIVDLKNTQVIQIWAVDEINNDLNIFALTYDSDSFDSENIKNDYNLPEPISVQKIELITEPTSEDA